MSLALLRLLLELLRRDARLLHQSMQILPLDPCRLSRLADMFFRYLVSGPTGSKTEAR